MWGLLSIINFYFIIVNLVEQGTKQPLRGWVGGAQKLSKNDSQKADQRLRKGIKIFWLFSSLFYQIDNDKVKVDY
jgi:hypothetical protein